MGHPHNASAAIDGDSFDEAISLHQAGRIDEAEQIYLRVLQRQPDHPGALHLLGVIRQQQSDHEAAVELIGRAISINPNKAVYRNNFGAALLSLGRCDEAIESFQKSLAICPNYPDALANLGLAEASLGRDQAALTSFRQALAIDTRHSDARKRLAALLYDMGQVKEAAGALEAACKASPSPAVFVDLGDFYMKDGRSQHAQWAYCKAIELDPTHATAHYRLGQALESQFDTAGARQHFLRAAELRPDKPGWRLRAEVCLPAVFESAEAIEECFQRMETALQRTQFAAREDCDAVNGTSSGSGKSSPAASVPIGEGEATDVVDTPLFPGFGYSYHGRNQRRLKERFATLFEMHFRNRGQAAKLPGSREVCNPRSGNRRRVGFVVTRRHEGIFDRCTAGLLRHLDPERFEPVVLAPRTSIDILRQRPANDRLRYIAFRDTFADAVRTIREAACDLIYYWEVGSDAMNYFLPFARLAPVQCTSHGSLITTGVPAIDWFFTSDLMEGEEAAEHYSERVWKSRTLLMHQERLAPVAPAPRGKWGLPEGRHLYGCLQNPLKLHPDFDRLMAGILAADPLATIVLLADKPGLVAALQDRYARHIVGAAERITFVPRQKFADYCGLLQACDVLLDPLHYGAGSSCYDVFSFNLPMVTLPTALMPGRVALGFYRKMQFEELVVASAEEYVNKAVRVATDRDYRQHVMDCIAARSDVLFNDLEAVREHERFFEETLSRVWG